VELRNWQTITDLAPGILSGLQKEAIGRASDDENMQKSILSATNESMIRDTHRRQMSRSDARADAVRHRLTVRLTAAKMIEIRWVVATICKDCQSSPMNDRALTKPQKMPHRTVPPLIS